MRRDWQAAAALVRKSKALGQRVNRWQAWRRACTRGGPYLRSMVLVNSLPKSGTHLLAPIVADLTGARSYGVFVASTPSLTLRERSANEVVQILRRSPGQELVKGHLYHERRLATWLRESGVCHLFLYRDARAVVVSEAYYLAAMNPWHRLHRRYAKASSTRDRILLSIHGIKRPDGTMLYGSIGDRLQRYGLWLDEQGVLGVRFEDLVAPDGYEEVGRIAEFLRARSPASSEAKGRGWRQVWQRGLGASSHTRRLGSAGGWWNDWDEHLEDEIRSSIPERLHSRFLYSD